MEKLGRLLRLPVALCLATPAVAPSLAHADDPVGGKVGGMALSMSPRTIDGTRRFALVIGSNHTLDDDLTPLKFADDDAARITEVLVEAGVDVELVASLDRESQALFPELVTRSHRPDRAGLDQAWKLLRERMEAAKQAGAPATELLIYYSGHGDVGPDGQGYLTLDGGKLKRRDLFRHVLAKSPADHNHVLIDACKSEQFVLTRGKPWKADRSAMDYGEAVGEYLDKNHLGHFPNTGVLLAHSADQQTHEWERYRGGIFTHQLVSGLRGGADLNGDGHIEYSELGAFVSAANSGVSDPRARLSVVVRPPKDDERHPLVTHVDVAQRRVLYFEPGDRHRYTLEDSRGVRIADVRWSGEQPGYLRLPAGDVFVQRQTPTASEDDREEAALPAGQTGPVLATALPFSAAQSASRGSLDQAFRAGLFATPFGPGYYSGYTDQTGLLGVAEPEWHVEIWKEVDGKREKVAEVVTDTEPQIEVEGEEPGPEEAKQEGDDDKDEKKEDLVEKFKHREDRLPTVSWGSVQVGTIFTPFRGDEAVALSPKKVTADQFRACLNPHDKSICSPIRGLDLRWNFFQVGGDERFPRFVWWFRSGYQGGHLDFAPVSGEADFADGNPTRMSTLTVPLHFGSQIYVFDDFPLRPYAGLGLGFDVVQARYRRQNEADRIKTTGLFGFELHAGLELRITNYIALNAEVMQLWTTRNRVDRLPDFANTGLTFITGIAAGFPLTPRAFRQQQQRRRNR